MKKNQSQLEYELEKLPVKLWSKKKPYLSLNNKIKKVLNILVSII